MNKKFIIFLMIFLSEGCVSTEYCKKNIELDAVVKSAESYFSEEIGVDFKSDYEWPPEVDYLDYEISIQLIHRSSNHLGGDDFYYFDYCSLLMTHVWREE